MSMCQARILSAEIVIPGTSEICHTTAECGGESFKKVVVDDGDAHQHICKGCVKRFLTKGSSKSSWYGWFDCDYPPEARVKYSPWYNKMLKDGAKECIAVDILVEKMGVMSVSLETKASSMILQEIAAIEGWIRGEGKTKFKEQPKMLKKLIDLRTQLKLLKK